MTLRPDPFAAYWNDPRTLYKKHLVRIFEFWKEYRPAFYTLLSNLPLTSFRIVADDDYRETLDEWTVPGFLEHLDLFHERLTYFSVHYQTYLYRSEWDDCAPNWRKSSEYFCGVERSSIRHPRALLDLSELFEPILACQLRESMLEGERFDLEPVYRVLSTEARTQFEKMVQECSDRLRGEFRELVSNLQPLL